MQVIGPFRINPAQATQAAQGASRVPSAAGENAAAPRSSGSIDQLDISPQAKAASETSAPSTVGGDILLDKVADLRRQIASGNYDTPEKMDIALGRLLDQFG